MGRKRRTTPETDNSVVNDGDDFNEADYENQLVPYKPMPLQLPKEGAFPEITNYEGEATEKWKFSASCRGEGCLAGGNQINKPFRLKYFFAHQAQYRQDDESFREGIRVVLVNDEGEKWAFGSNGIWESLQVLIHHNGLGPYEPPLDIQVTQTQLKGGRSWLQIEPANEVTF